MSVATKEGKSSLGGCATVLFLLFPLSIPLYFWKPWYTRAGAAQIGLIRHNAQDLHGGSIEHYLKEHREQRNLPPYANAPAEYYWLDTIVEYSAGLSCCLWPFIFFVVFGDNARKVASTQPLTEQLAAPAEETMTAAPNGLVYKLTCTYCGQSFVTNGLEPGQAVNCPHCAGIVQVPVG